MTVVYYSLKYFDNKVIIGAAKDRNLSYSDGSASFDKDVALQPKRIIPMKDDKLEKLLFSRDKVTRLIGWEVMFKKYNFLKRNDELYL